MQSRLLLPILFNNYIPNNIYSLNLLIISEHYKIISFQTTHTLQPQMQTQRENNQLIWHQDYHEKTFLWYI